MRVSLRIPILTINIHCLKMAIWGHTLFSDTPMPKETMAEKPSAASWSPSSGGALAVVQGRVRAESAGCREGAQPRGAAPHHG